MTLKEIQVFKCASCAITITIDLEKITYLERDRQGYAEIWISGMQPMRTKIPYYEFKGWLDDIGSPAPSFLASLESAKTPSVGDTLDAIDGHSKKSKKARGDA